MRSKGQKKARLRKKSGFTLVELLLVLAIITILAGIILVTVSSQRKRAHQAKAISELSAVIQPILMCRSDDETVNTPHSTLGGGNICGANNNYGTWPVPPTAGGFETPYEASDNAGFEDGNWRICIDDGADTQICCNSTYSRCKLIDNGDCTNCAVDTNLE